MSQYKNRLDKLLVEKKYFVSREAAKRAIMAGEVYVDGVKSDKAGTMVGSEQSFEVRSTNTLYVSRGGLKLEKALERFNIDVSNRIIMDVGASTGGFTDCLLRNGAKLVYAIDVGYGQFAWKLRNDPRVVCMERTNIRYVTSNEIHELCDMAVIDVSFISLRLVLPVVASLLKQDGVIIALVKPQFEAGREKIGKKGVVKELNTHFQVLKQIMDFSNSIHLSVVGLDFSPITGPKGNIEFLLYLTKAIFPNEIEVDALINQVIADAHKELL